MDRVIIHSDANCFYASVEMLYHPEFAGKPLAVGGDPEARHGIVLTANYIAKKHGVKTGMALWRARQACPDVIFVPPRMDLYLKFSSMLREIYGEYTDKIEPYGCDEAWLDVSDSISLKGDGRKIADEISARVKKELGITVSEGISWNKIYAKLGSDYKKPDAITEFNRENYKSPIWKLPASDLLYVGRSTHRTLSKYGIHTIGDLACTDPDFLLKTLGKMGLGTFMELALPNKEIRRVYNTEILSWLRGTVDGNEGRTRSGGPWLCADRSGTETFYHGMMLGLAAGMSSRYYIRSNRESGEGRFDLVLDPKVHFLPGIIMEFKATKNDAGLSASADEALKQIEDKHYDTDMKDRGIREIVKYGIAFAGKNVEIAIG